MKLRKALEEKTMDVRLRDRHMGDGKIAKSDVDSYLSSLSDEEGNYEQVDSTVAGTEEVTE